MNNDLNNNYNSGPITVQPPNEYRIYTTSSKNSTTKKSNKELVTKEKTKWIM